MMIVNSDFDFSLLDDIDPSRFENIEDLHISNIKSKDGKKSKLKHAKVFKKLRNMKLFNCESLDVESLFEDIPNPDELYYLSIDTNLPDVKQVERFKNIRNIDISGVEDSKKLFNFLEALPLENLKEICIINCNLENMPENLIARLSSVTRLMLAVNKNADYNHILKSIPKKELLESLVLNDVKDNDFELDISQIENFNNLKCLSCSNFKLDFDRFKEYLDEESELESLFLCNTNLDNLDFLSNARTAIQVDIVQDNIDFKMLTPEIAKKQSLIRLLRSNTSEEITTKFDRRKQDDLNRTLSISRLSVNAEELENIESLLSSADDICKTEITVSDNLSPVENVFLKYSDKILFSYSLFTSSFSMIEEEDISRLNRKLGHINVVDTECDDRKSGNRFAYKPEEYIELKKKIEEITGDIPRDLSDLQKFMIIYRRLGAKISYDYGIIGKNQYSQYAKDNLDNCRNCVNGLMRNTCVCAGYADILYNCLREVGIECYKISGLAGDYHQWNKVKLDGKFYNTDLTWDATELSKNTIFRPQWCLRGDNFFGKRHKENFGKKDACLGDMSNSKIRQALKFAMEFDGIKIKNPIEELFDEMKADLNDFYGDLKKLFLPKKMSLPAPQEKINVSINTRLSNSANVVKEDKRSWDLGENKEAIQAEMDQISRNVPSVVIGNQNKKDER